MEVRRRGCIAFPYDVELHGVMWSRRRAPDSRWAAVFSVFCNDCSRFIWAWVIPAIIPLFHYSNLNHFIFVHAAVTARVHERWSAKNMPDWHIVAWTLFLLVNGCFTCYSSSLKQRLYVISSASARGSRASSRPTPYSLWVVRRFR